MSICGLDFGTSNTTLGTLNGAAPVLAALEAEQTAIPSAIFRPRAAISSINGYRFI